MGDIKLKKGTGILFVMAVLFISSLLYLHYGDQNTLRVGIFYGSNWEVPGTVHYEILDQAIKKFESKYPNVKVEYEKGILSNDYSEWLSEQILKGTEPDVYLVLDEDFNTLASLGALKNLDMLVGGDKEFDSNVFYSSVYKAGQYEEAYEKTDSLIKSYVDEEGDSSTFLFQMKNQIDKILKK